MSKLDRRHVEKLEEMLLEENCQPSALIDCGHYSNHATTMNQMLYDKFHEQGWELDLMTGKFIKK